MSTEFDRGQADGEPKTAGYEGAETVRRAGLQSRMRGFTLESSFYLQAVADRLGMAVTDLNCLTVLFTDGPVSAGTLAERAGLTTGAITGLVDRLERAGWVRRVHDPNDRRRVIVEPDLSRAGAFRPLLDPMLREAATMQAGFTESEQAAIVSFVEQSTEMLGRQVSWLRRAVADGPVVDNPTVGAGGIRVPREGLVAAQLGVRGIGTDIRITTEDLGATLCVVDFGERPATVTARDGRVEVSRSGRGRWRSRDNQGRIILHRAVRWDLSVRGGAARLEVDLGGGQLDAVSISGGASTVDLSLPTPDRRVPIKLSGGASRVRARRPAGVAVSGRARGGAVSIKIDGAVLTSSGGTATLGDPRGAGVGYDFEVSGGASSVEVTEA